MKRLQMFIVTFYGTNKECAGAFVAGAFVMPSCHNRFIDILQANVLNHLVSNTDKLLISLMGNERNIPFANFHHANDIRLSRDVYHLHVKSCKPEFTQYPNMKPK